MKESLLRKARGPNLQYNWNRIYRDNRSVTAIRVPGKEKRIRLKITWMCDYRNHCQKEMYKLGQGRIQGDLGGLRAGWELRCCQRDHCRWDSPVGQRPEGGCPWGSSPFQQSHPVRHSQTCFQYLQLPAGPSPHPPTQTKPCSITWRVFALLWVTLSADTNHH